MAKVKKDQKNLEEQLARALADYDNLVKRSVREREETVLRATQGFIEDLLPVLDSLERAEDHLKDAGLKMGMDQLRQTLVRSGVEQIDSKGGEKFDNELHEAIESIEGGKSGTIAQILTKGYKWRDGWIIRPAKIRVYNEGKKEEELN